MKLGEGILKSVGRSVCRMVCLLFSNSSSSIQAIEILKYPFILFSVTYWDKGYFSS